MAFLSTPDAAPPAAPHRSRAADVANQLRKALQSHDIDSDVFDFVSGRVAVSVGPGLLPVTDGEHIWWFIPEGAGGTRRSAVRMAVYRTPELAAARLAAQAADNQEQEVVLDALPI